MNTDPAQADSEALQIMAGDLRERHGAGVCAILYYGSCLRSGDPFAGVVDLYLIVDRYRAVYERRRSAVMNWLLPPNVFYREIDVAGNTLRAKYNILSRADLLRNVSAKSMRSYFWGRFCQPMYILWSRDTPTAKFVESCREQAIRTFLDSVLPVCQPSGLVRQLWVRGLALSYATELRSESPTRAAMLVDYSPAYYHGVTLAVAPALRWPLVLTGDGDAVRYDVTIAPRRRMVGRLSWKMRRMTGKTLSVVQLLKSIFTFEGGLEYAVWKLERHTGHRIDIPERVRRHPLIFAWPLLWRLIRRGILQ